VNAESLYLEFEPGNDLRFLQMTVFPVHPFVAPAEIFFVRRPAVQTCQGAVDRAQNSGSRFDAVAFERVAVHAAPWPAGEEDGCAQWLLRPGHWFVAVPHPWGAASFGRGTTLRIRFTSDDEAIAQATLRACPVRALLGKVILIALGDSGGELGGLQKEGPRVWSGW